MPRVKMAEEAYKDKDLSELIRRYKYGKNLTNVDIAKKLGVCATTWKCWLSEPTKIPLGKLRLLRKHLCIPKEEILPFVM